jgi:outer membrane protein assembly factor BamB
VRRSLVNTLTVIATASIVTSVSALPAAAASGDRLWLRRYNSGPSGQDVAGDIEVTPDGRHVIVTGSPSTIAYDATSGATEWHVDPGFDAMSVGVNGERAFVSGCVCVLAAYDTATGSRIWQRIYGTEADRVGAANDVAVSGTGKRVFITGHRVTYVLGNSDYDFATTAVAAGTGKRLWTRTYDGPLSDDVDSAQEVVTTSDGGLVFVTGNSADLNGQAASTTIAYDGVTGERLWRKTFSPGWGNGVAIDPAGTTVFVTGISGFKTIALDASTGLRIWARGLSASTDDGAFGYDVAVTPDGAVVVVSGEEGNALTTIAYDAATGAPLWQKRYQGPGGYSQARALSITGDGARVVVAGFDAVLVGDTINGSSFDLATLAYNVDTGSRSWLRRYDGAGDQDFPVGIKTAPDGSTAFVSGSTRTSSGLDDYVTIAYEA